MSELCPASHKNADEAIPPVFCPDTDVTYLKAALAPFLREICQLRSLPLGSMIRGEIISDINSEKHFSNHFKEVTQ